MPIDRQRVAKNIPAEADARNNKISITRQRRSEQALTIIQAVFRGVNVKWIEETTVPKLVVLGVQN
jgi:hypothetical protein